MGQMMRAGYYRFMNTFTGIADVVSGRTTPDRIERSNKYEQEENDAIQKLNELVEGNDSAPAQIVNYVAHKVVPAMDHFVNGTEAGRKAQRAADSIEKPIIKALIYANRTAKKVAGSPQIRDMIAGIGKPRGYVEQMKTQRTPESEKEKAEEHVYPTKITYTDESSQTYQMDMELSGGEAGSFIQMGLRVEPQRDGTLGIYGTPEDATILRCYAVIRDNIFRNFNEANQSFTLPISSGPSGNLTEDVNFSVADILEMQQSGYRYDPKRHVFVGKGE